MAGVHAHPVPFTELSEAGSRTEEAHLAFSTRAALDETDDQDSGGFLWSDRHLLGHGTMDDTHREFVHLVDRLLTAPDEALHEALQAFEAHAQAHFGQENEWMAQEGFPGRECHEDEHAKVLASVHEVQALLDQGEVDLVRELAQALAHWFPAHADHMDSALAGWLVEKRHGARPLVLRRC